MQTFFVECYVPGLTRRRLRSLVARARTATARMRSSGTRIRELCWIFLPEDETVFYLIEATSKRSVEELIREAAMPVERIVDAVRLAALSR